MNNTLLTHVDENDEILGFVPKLKAHELGLLHRAVSVLIFNTRGEWLLQKRAKNKYHSGGLWTNTSCSHPYVDEDVETAAHRRLQEEMGLKCKLKKSFRFHYKSKLENGLIEHEIDHVFIGITDELPIINSEEAEDWKYISESELSRELNKEPEKFTSWFKLIFEKMEKEPVFIE